MIIDKNISLQFKNPEICYSNKYLHQNEYTLQFTAQSLFWKVGLSDTMIFRHLKGFFPFNNTLFGIIFILFM